MYAATKCIAHELGLTTPVICYQGGLVKDFNNNDTTLLEDTMDVELARDVINELKKRKLFFNLYINDVLMVEEDHELIRQYVDARNISYKVVGNCDNIDLTGVNKILAIDDNTTLIEDLQKELAKNMKESFMLYVQRQDSVSFPALLPQKEMQCASLLKMGYQ